jgi:integrase
MDRGTRQTRRKTTGTSDLEQAERRLAEHFQLSERLDRERPTDVPLMTILERYYHEHARNLPSAPQVRYAIESLREFFGTATIADFRKKDQEQMAATLRERGRAESYISRILSVAKAALRRAYDNEEIAAIPPIIRLPRGEPRDRVLTLQETAALFNAALNGAQFLFLLLAFGTGARPSAILELRRLQLDFDRKVIRLNPPGRKQTKKRRAVVPMAPTVMHWLDSTGSGYVVNHAGLRYTKDGWDSIFARLVKRAGVTGVSPYTIRHTIATEMATRGVPWLEIKTFLGHRIDSSDITGHYVHMRPDDLRGAVAALEQYFTELAPLVKRPLIQSKLEEDQPLPDSETSERLRAQRVPTGPRSHRRDASKFLMCFRAHR